MFYVEVVDHFYYVDLCLYEMLEPLVILQCSIARVNMVAFLQLTKPGCCPRACTVFQDGFC